MFDELHKTGKTQENYLDLGNDELFYVKFEKNAQIFYMQNTLSENHNLVNIIRKTGIKVAFLEDKDYDWGFYGENRNEVGFPFN